MIKFVNLHIFEDNNIMLALSKNYIGTPQDLLYDGSSYRWGESSCDVYGLNTPLFQLMKIYSIDPPEIVPAKYLEMQKYLNCVDTPNYPKLLGSRFVKRLKLIVPMIYDSYMDVVDKEYYSVFVKTQRFLDSLVPGPIDLIRYNVLKSAEKLPQGFDIEHGMLPSPRYIRSNTKTGRMTVCDGPSVLTLKKEYRNILKECRQIDYSSMEPLFLLAISGKRVDGDLYEWLSERMGKKMSRAKAKIAVLSSLYGQRTHREIEKIFDLRSWLKKLNSSVKENVIENYFGRPIHVEGVRDNKLLALWLQSSAVDAALLGFCNFFEDNQHLRPHWVIHDACIFSGNGKVPSELKITEDIYLPIACTGV